MKADICEFCGMVVPESDDKTLLYELVIAPAENFEAREKRERLLTLTIEHICFGCTQRVRELVDRVREMVRPKEVKKNHWMR